jgi:methyl-accepting chemotaxis protein
MFSNLSIKWKVVLGITVTSTASILFAAVVFASLEISRLNDTLEREARTLTGMVGTSSVGALAFEDAEGARELILALRAGDQVRNAVIYDQDGAPFVWYAADGGSVRTGTGTDLPSGLAPRAPAPGLETSDETLRVVQPILFEGERQGTVALWASRSGVGDAIAAFAGTTVLVVVGALALAVTLAWLVQGAILRPLSAIIAAMRDIAEGDSDLTKRLRAESEDELGELAHWFNAFVTRMHDAMATVSRTAAQLAEASASSSETSRKACEGAESQQNEISQVAAALNQMATTVQEVASNVAHAAENAGSADDESMHGRQVVQETMEAIRQLATDIGRASDVIERLQKDSENIGSVLDVIRGIAEQTNLLALNAAIEAARAGEQGRGFAVVADEVRTLASRTQSSTEEIHGMIERLQQGSREAVSVMAEGRQQADGSVEKAEQAATRLDAITRAVNDIRNMTTQIATASREQSEVTEEINRRIANISQVSNSTASGARENAARSEDMVRLSGEMRGLVADFRT